jgi:NADH-quinone oxidoreductase subunit A
MDGRIREVKVTRMGFDFVTVLAVAVVAILFALGGITASRLAGPRAPSADKASTYECGERPVGVAWFNFNPRFYLVALAFVVFEVDVALTFPVVAVYKQWVESSPFLAWSALLELFLFTAILVVGLGWIWARGDLDWVKRLSARPDAGRRAAPGGKPPEPASHRPAA